MMMMDLISFSKVFPLLSTHLAQASVLFQMLMTLRIGKLRREGRRERVQSECVILMMVKVPRDWEACQLRWMKRGWQITCWKKIVKQRVLLRALKIRKEKTRGGEKSLIVKGSLKIILACCKLRTCHPSKATLRGQWRSTSLGPRKYKPLASM
uniref:Uncharacterized protein n=1 Tax=Opuntia streptacantha TaxID=393608 RepID=A0A7C8YLM2_OPUST